MNLVWRTRKLKRQHDVGRWLRGGEKDGKSTRDSTECGCCVSALVWDDKLVALYIVLTSDTMTMASGSCRAV